jgi:poly(3-hydroxybutyrate) depolymerase
MLRTEKWIAGGAFKQRWMLPALALALALAVPALRVSAADDDPSTLQRNSVSVDGQNRDYFYFVSSKVDPRGFNLVVYALHDNGQSVEEFAQQSGWLQVAEQNGFVVVFPAGQGKRWLTDVARWPDTPNGDIGRLLTRDEVQQQFTTRTLDVDGQTYTYYLSLPPNWHKGSKLLLVLAEHGGGFPAWLYLSQIKMHEVGQKEDFMTAYVQAQGYAWHFVDPEGPDSRFIQKAIADVETNFRADSHRIYMQGFSLGSGMSYMMGITHPQLFAAISPNSGIGPMSSAVEASVAAIKAKSDIRMPVIIPYGVADHGGSIDGQIPADIGVLRPAFDEWKGFNHISTPDRVEPYDSPSSPPYNILVPGGKLVRAAFDERYPDGRFKIYEYYSDDPKPLNLFDFAWIEDMAHGQDPREAQLEWDYFKHWRRNSDGSLSFVDR